MLKSILPRSAITRPLAMVIARLPTPIASSTCAATNHANPLTTLSRGVVFDGFAKQHPPQISSSDLAARGLGPQDAIVDVRPDVEREQLGALREYTAIDLEEILDEDSELGDRLPGGSVFILCRSGRRSNVAASVLRKIGVDAWNISDGILGFQENGIDSVPRRAE